MFCANCGEKLNVTNQRFCHNCGTETIATAKAINYKTQRIQSVTAPKIHYTLPIQQRQMQMGRPGKYSKLCLWLALASIVIGIGTLIVGYNSYRLFYWPYSNFIVRLVVSIVLLILRVGGLTMGILSRVNSSKAETFEPYNDVEKAGSILAVMGIIINAIGLFLSVLGPWSIFSFPMYLLG